MEENKTTGVETTTTENQNTEVRTYTQEEVDRLLQSESDRRVSEALKKADRKTQEAVREAQKLAAMNEQEKYAYELEQREKALAEKERALSLAENKNEAGKILSEKGLSLSLVDFVVAEDASKMKSNIDLLDKAFKASVKAEVEKRLNSNIPNKSSTSNGNITREQFKKMDCGKRAKLYKENPELYKQLSN